MLGTHFCPFGPFQPSNNCSGWEKKGVEIQKIRSKYVRSIKDMRECGLSTRVSNRIERIDRCSGGGG